MSDKNSETSIFFLGAVYGVMLGGILIVWDKIENNDDDYRIAQCVELKKYLEKELADNSKKEALQRKKEDLQRKLEQLEKWEIGE